MDPQQLLGLTAIRDRERDRSDCLYRRDFWSVIREIDGISLLESYSARPSSEHRTAAAQVRSPATDSDPTIDVGTRSSNPSFTRFLPTMMATQDPSTVLKEIHA